MKLYFVKNELPGLPAGRVERFHAQRAAYFEGNGDIEPFDPKNSKHAAALKAQEKADDDRRLAAEAELKLEREKPEEYHRLIQGRRAAAEKVQAEQQKEAARVREARDAAAN